MSLNEIANARPGTGTTPLNPQTPRTLAFNRLGGTKDLPLRNHFGSSTGAEAAPKSPGFPSRFALRSPTFPKSPLSPGFKEAERKADQEMSMEARMKASAGAGPVLVQVEMVECISLHRRKSLPRENR